MVEKYNAIGFHWRWPVMFINVSSPPTPVPLTVGCVATVFAPPGLEPKYLASSDPSATPRVADPCPQIKWPRWTTPTDAQMNTVIDALQRIANIRRVNFLATGIIVELQVGDASRYPMMTMPGIVAGANTNYHYSELPFFKSMSTRTRERLIDPARYVPLGGPLPQDNTNYLVEWSKLTPGMRASRGPNNDEGSYAGIASPTTSGIQLRKGTTTCVTVANRGFPNTDEVFDPDIYGDKIGGIVDRYPETGIAMVKLTPLHQNRYDNSTYFQAEPPKRLIEQGGHTFGSWYEVDGMSTGLISLQQIGFCKISPSRPLGHSRIPGHQWLRSNVLQIFGAINPELVGGLCGAPIVGVEAGHVADFFHLASGDYAESAALDDLIAEGWEVV
jgi:hypothetical protein